MPQSKTKRKSKSGQSRKINRLKNGNTRHTPGLGKVPGAPSAMNWWMKMAAPLTGEEKPQFRANQPEPVVAPSINIPPATSNPTPRTPK